MKPNYNPSSNDCAHNTTAADVLCQIDATQHRKAKCGNVYRGCVPKMANRITICIYIGTCDGTVNGHVRGQKLVRDCALNGQSTIRLNNRRRRHTPLCQLVNNDVAVGRSSSERRPLVRHIFRIKSRKLLVRVCAYFPNRSCRVRSCCVVVVVRSVGFEADF